MSLRIGIVCACLVAGLSALAFGEAPATPSSPVYRQPAPHPRFRHSTAAHAAEACTRCHALPAPSPSDATPPAAPESLQPTEASCAPCHAAAMDRAQPSAPGCTLCHDGFDATSSHVPDWPRTRAELRFSHRSHAARGVECKTCHAGADPRALPTMAQCLDCHQKPESRRCATCHPTLPDGRLKQRLAGGALLVPRSPWLGMQHDSDWGVRHRWVAADEPATCQSCHAERDCRRCHDGRRPPPSVHPNDFLSLHAQDARREPARCARCHSAQTFCMECHSRLGVSTVSPPDIRGGQRYHPPASQWIRGPVRHAVEARRALSACVSCHAENDCVQCHGAGRVGGGGVSPHPDAFFQHCGKALEANPRACRTCHGDPSTLRARCP